MGENVKRPYAAAARRGCLRQLLVRAIGAVFGLGLVAAALVVANRASRSATPERILVPFFVLLGVGMILLIGGSFTVVIVRSRRFDKFFEALGSPGRMYGLGAGRPPV